ncbi:MAG: CHAT domain-containing protein [Pseudomonadales bacterium]|nr:CHAT domain-containing protein [Pseudomonadales bacterium]
MGLSLTKVNKNRISFWLIGFFVIASFVLLLADEVSLPWRESYTDQSIIFVAPDGALNFVSDGETETLDVPGSARMPLILLTSKEGYSLEADTFSRGPPNILETLADPSIQAKELARKLTTAARLWANGKTQEALALYLNLIQETPADSIDADLVRLRQYAALYGAIGSSSQYDGESEDLFIAALSNSVNDIFLQSAIPAIKESVKVEDADTRAEARKQLIALLENREWPESWAGLEASIRHSIGYAYLLDSQTDIGERYINQAMDLVSWHTPTLASYHNMQMYTDIRRAWLASTAAEKQPLLERSNNIAFEGLNLANASDSHATSGLILNNIATNYMRLGDYENAQRNLRESLRIVEGRFSPFSRTTALINLGKVYRDLGEQDRARSYLSEGIDSARQAGELARIPIAQCVLGTVERNDGRLDEAIALHRECLAGSRQQQNLTLEVEAALELSEDLRLANNFADASEHLSIARALLEENSDVDNELILRSRSMIRSALIMQLAGNENEANKHLEFALDYVPRLLDPIARIEVLYKAMLVYQDRGDHNSVLEISNQTLAAVESFFSVLEPQRLGPAWSARNYPIVETVLRSQVETKIDPIEMLRTIERMQSINLRRMISGQADLAASPDRLNTISELADQRAEYLESNDEIRQNAYIENELFLAEAWQSTQRGEATEFMLQDMREQLDSDTAAIRFLILDSDIYAFTVTDSTITFEETGPHTEPIEEEEEEEEESKPTLFDLAEAVVDLRSVSSEDKSNTALNLVSAYLPDSLNEITASRLLIVNDGLLNRVPYSMLLDNNGKHLMTRFELSIVPSLSALQLSESSVETSNNRIDVAVFANPDLGSEASNFDAPDRVRSWAKDLPSLPWADEEAKMIESTLENHEVVSFTGKNATLAALLDEQHRQAKILHIATHGYFKDSGADNVGFVLASSNADSENRFVTMTELLSYRFDNNLVVVSGCDTSIDETFEGEGSLSVTRAFLARGAKSVIGTLWPVSDSASAAFMTHFYEELSISGDPISSLRAAQLAMIGDKSSFKDPYYWAGYRLTTTELLPTIPGIGS